MAKANKKRVYRCLDTNGEEITFYFKSGRKVEKLFAKLGHIDFTDDDGKELTHVDTFRGYTFD